MNTNEVEKQFAKDIAGHAMEVVRDEGVHRHIRFYRPGTGIDSFSLVTWPGYLCFCGDRGTYVFHRLVDMFDFFRRPYPDMGYWAEKCEAEDRDGIREYDPYKFRRAVLTELRSYRQSSSKSPCCLATIRQFVIDDVLSMADEGQDAAVSAAMNFNIDGFSLPDFYEHDVTSFTYRFMWACFAIRWGVTKYRLMAEVGAGGEA